MAEIIHLPKEVFRNPRSTGDRFDTENVSERRKVFGRRGFIERYAQTRGTDAPAVVAVVSRTLKNCRRVVDLDTQRIEPGLVQHLQAPTAQ